MKITIFHHYSFWTYFWNFFQASKKKIQEISSIPNTRKPFQQKKWLLPTRRARFGAVETLIEAQPISPSIVEEYIFRSTPPTQDAIVTTRMTLHTFLAGHPYKPSFVTGMLGGEVDPNVCVWKQFVKESRTSGCDDCCVRRLILVVS